MESGAQQNLLECIRMRLTAQQPFDGLQTFKFGVFLKLNFRSLVRPHPPLLASPYKYQCFLMTADVHEILREVRVWDEEFIKPNQHQGFSQGPALQTPPPLFLLPQFHSESNRNSASQTWLPGGCTFVWCTDVPLPLLTLAEEKRLRVRSVHMGNSHSFHVQDALLDMVVVLLNFLLTGLFLELFFVL